MPDTNSVNPPDQNTDGAWSQDANHLPVLDGAGHALFERIGVGGMGEVYRCGDDALRRDLAIKVIKAEMRGDHDAEERFLREARLTGSLQHPGVVPVHNLGKLADGRLYYTMKLVRGRTLADLLRDEPEGPEHLPRLLAVVEKLCQAMGYAHSMGVIHRDLKPSNVMVGEFGEVQVMDWGLAKELARAEPVTPSGAATQDVETVGRVEEAACLSRAGAALGTPAYMPPEQAAGDWDIVDERADVFALGAILCEVLTGRPPYHGTGRDDLLRRARRGDLAETLGRLERCGADTALLDLCRDCLAAVREGRPRTAEVVAERLATYQAEVRERLRQAELERARAEVQALEQRKRRRLGAALSLAAMLLLLGGAVVWWQGQRRQAEADGAATQVMNDARRLNEEARADPLNPAGYEKAVLAAAKAGEVARAGGASQAVQRQSDDLLSEMRQEQEAAEKDRRLLARILETRGPREGPKFSRDDKGTMMALAEPTADELFTSAFRDWGLNVDAVPVAEAAVRLKERPVAVVTEAIAGLDEWANQRRLDKKPESAKRVAELAAALDVEAGSLRRELREILAREQLPVEQGLRMLSAALRPVPVPVALPLGRDGARLRQLAESIDPAAEPVLGLLTLVRALRVAGEEALAERLLRKALTARPREVVLYHSLGQLLTEQKPQRRAAAVEFYRAARSLRPDLGVTLARSLLHSERAGEGLDLLAQMVSESPANPYLHYQRAFALGDQNKYGEAEAACRQAINVKPDYAEAYLGLGIALYHQEKRVEAEAACRKALALKPDFAEAYVGLSMALADQGKPGEAEAACRKAIDLKPDYAVTYYNLGVILCDYQGKPVEAEAAFRKAIALNPDDAEAYSNLGTALGRQGKPVEAEAAFRKALAFKPDYAEVYCNLGIALARQGRFTESLMGLRRGHELGLKQSGWSYPSLQWVRKAESLVELEKKLAAILQGQSSPANPSEALALALMCQQHKKRYAAAARLYAVAFAAEPKLAADLNQQHRYNAACSAALAAAGQGSVTHLLPDKVVTMFRRWALDWLRADLTAYAKLAEQNNPAVKQTIQQRLAHWRRDPDLASVRDQQSLDLLPENESAAWHALWRDVDELAKKAEPTQGRKEP
jgi:serine/threonine-protein kinase